MSNNIIITVTDHAEFFPLTDRLEGYRKWLDRSRFTFEATPANVTLLRRYCPDVPMPAPKPAELVVERMAYQQATAPYAHQTRALEKARLNQHFALFMEQGTGKTKIAIDRAGELWAAGEICGVLVVTKKGVHSQWAHEQIPLHLGVQVPRYIELWGDKRFTNKQRQDPAFMQWLLMNVDALNTKLGFARAEAFLKNKKTMMIIDESHIIKNSRAQRTKAAYALAPLAAYRMIMTGTPIAKDLCDEWAQFKFLDERILRHRYLTSFRNQYCIMGGFEGRQVIGHRNLEEFKARTAPYSFRVTKEEELDLPPKVFSETPFEMSPEQKKHYQQLKHTLMSEFSSGENLSVKNAVALLMRLQQVTCGFLSDGTITQDLENPRLEALLQVLEQRAGKAVIWARFTHDIKTIAKALGAKAVTFFGESSQKERDEAKQKFLDPNSGIDYFVSNPSVGGVGLNLQGDCRTAIYYSNSFNAIDRWQSEDRIHRIGATQAVTYVDLICVGALDRKILHNLRKRKSISELALGDIKKLIDGEEDEY